MAMNAKQAAELIRNGNFNDADELYDALNGQKEYGAEFARLLQHIETKVKLDMSLYTGLATSAKAVEELSAATDPLDEKDPAFADTRKRLEKVELYQTVSENGKEVSKAVEGKERDKMIAQIVAAAKLEADSELRGASSPESPAAKKFMNAADAEAKKAVYRETLNEKIDLALLQLSCCRNDQNQPGNGQEIFRRQKKGRRRGKNSAFRPNQGNKGKDCQYRQIGRGKTVDRRRRRHRLLRQSVGSGGRAAGRI